MKQQAKPPRVPQFDYKTAHQKVKLITKEIRQIEKELKQKEHFQSRQQLIARVVDVKVERYKTARELELALQRCQEVLHAGAVGAGKAVINGAEIVVSLIFKIARFDLTVKNLQQEEQIKDLKRQIIIKDLQRIIEHVRNKNEFKQANKEGMYKS